MRLEEFKNKLLSISESDFPGDQAHLEMTPYKKNLVIEKKDPRLSSVVVLAYENQEMVHFLLLKRSDYQGVHSAQVSFPGGKKDESDRDLLHTAVRELSEETGIIIQEQNIIRPLSTMYIPPSNFLVHPFVAVLPELPTIVLDERESQYSFGISISELLDDANLQTTEIKTSYGTLKNVPYFNLRNEIIWGATAAILNELKWILKK